jgi:Flp pilus assembly protein TadD
MAAAAYNLAILVADQDLKEAVSWCRRAVELRPDDTKYVYTLAFYLNQNGELEESSRLLHDLIQKSPASFEAYALLGNILERQGRLSEAKRVYEKALSTESVPPAARSQFEAMLATDH